MMYVKQLCVPEYSSVELEVSSKYEIVFLLYYSYLYPKYLDRPEQTV